MRKILLAAFVLAVSPLTTSGEDWPAFRGPRGDGTSPTETVPLHWSATENIRWHRELPTPSNGSPVVSAGAVFVTTSQDKDGLGRTLYCLDRGDGQIRWARSVKHPEKMPTHKTNPYCGSTPAADGQRVVVWHGSAGLYCYDFDGGELWGRDLGQFEHMWGYGTSPVIFDGMVIMHCSPGKRNFLAALDLETGNTLWEVEEPYSGDGDRRADGQYMGSWSTPLLAEIDGQTQVICAQPTRISAFDPYTGKRIWYCEGNRGPKGDLAYSSPVLAGEVMVAVGGYQGPSIGLTPGGSGNVTESRRLWRTEVNPQSIGTAVHVDGYLYRPNAGPSSVDCLDPRTGKSRWTERGTGKAHWGSIIYVGGHCYATDQDGTTLVFRPSPAKCEVVAMNKLDDPTNSTPAASEGELFMRTASGLWCISKGGS